MERGITTLGRMWGTKECHQLITIVVKGCEKNSFLTVRNLKQDQDHMGDHPGDAWGEEEQIYEFLIYDTEDMHLKAWNELSE